MARRFGKPRVGVSWLGVVLTLLGAASACGDGENSPNGTGGASTGGAKSGSGGAAGGSSGATPKAGSGASTSGTGGTPSSAGEGGAPGEGGTAPVAGRPGGGIGGDAGSSTVAGSPNAGESGAGRTGTGGRADGGTGGGTSGGDAGSGGGAEISVEYRSCEKGAAVTRVELYRIDRAQQTCTLVEVQQGQINCLEGLKSGLWCVIGAAISSDVEACEALERPSDPVLATAGVGTFTVTAQPLAIDIDVDFEFPANSGFPESVSVEADGCLADCAMNDCRP